MSVDGDATIAIQRVVTGAAEQGIVAGVANETLSPPSPVSVSS